MSACDAEPGAESLSEDERGAAAKADVDGSCESPEGEVACEGQGFGSCWCDELCVAFGDCCADAEELCGMEAPEPPCDPTRICTAVQTCVDGQLYPTGCGPENCDEPTEPCDGDSTPAPEPLPEPELDCNPLAFCPAAETCIDGLVYPTGCGSTNCDAPIGICEADPKCIPTLFCPAAQTCVDGELYPTGCGPNNCDEPLGPC